MMKPSPLMQQLIEQLAAKHKVDLTEPGASLEVAMLNQKDWLAIDTSDGRHITVSHCYMKEDGLETDPCILLLTDCPFGWLPLDILYSTSEWEAFVEATRPNEAPEAVELATLTEYWAEMFAAQGWLEKGVQKRHNC